MSDKKKIKTRMETVFGLTEADFGSLVGEANTASNQGTGAGLVMTKSGADLPFKSLKEGTTIMMKKWS